MSRLGDSKTSILRSRIHWSSSTHLGSSKDETFDVSRHLRTPSASAMDSNQMRHERSIRIDTTKLSLSSWDRVKSTKEDLLSVSVISSCDSTIGNDPIPVGNRSGMEASDREKSRHWSKDEDVKREYHRWSALSWPRTINGSKTRRNVCYLPSRVRCRDSTYCRSLRQSIDSIVPVVPKGKFSLT